MRFDKVRSDKSMLWNLLRSAGYLTLKSAAVQKSHVVCEALIPNQKVLGLYEDIFLHWLTPNEALEIRPFTQLLAEGKAGEFAAGIERFLKIAASAHDYANQPEIFIMGLCWR